MPRAVASARARARCAMGAAGDRGESWPGGGGRHYSSAAGRREQRRRASGRAAALVAGAEARKRICAGLARVGPRGRCKAKRLRKRGRGRERASSRHDSPGLGAHDHVGDLVASKSRSSRARGGLAAGALAGRDGVRPHSNDRYLCGGQRASGVAGCSLLAASAPARACDGGRRWCGGSPPSTAAAEGVVADALARVAAAGDDVASAAARAEDAVARLEQVAQAAASSSGGAAGFRRCLGEAGCAAGAAGAGRGPSILVPLALAFVCTTFLFAWRPLQRPAALEGPHGHGAGVRLLRGWEAAFDEARLG